jgi:adenylate cyclase
MTQEEIDQVWYEHLTTGHDNVNRLARRINAHLPGHPRCALCGAPLGGTGGFLLRAIMGVDRSRMNPRYCNDCERFAVEHPGGAEVELAMLFVDVRGSTTVAENLALREFTQLVHRFQSVASRILIQSDAMVEKLVGDQLTGLYVPGYAGPEYAKKALRAGLELQERMAHDVQDNRGLPVGIGIHVGHAYIGTVGSREGIVEITALGDDVNTAARLCQSAGPAELIVSDRAFQAAGIDVATSEAVEMRVKGREGVVLARTIARD